jgi:hypothetical protein
MAILAIVLFGLATTLITLARPTDAGAQTPLAPAGTEDQGIELRVSHLGVGFEPADCQRIPEGTMKVFLSLISTVPGVDILNGEGRVLLVPSGSGPQDPTLPMTNGNLERQAFDGTAPISCFDPPPGGEDLHANDLGSFVLSSGSLRQIQLSAPGYQPRVIDRFRFGGAEVPLTALGDGPVLGMPTGCPLGDGVGCLISLGTFQLEPLPSSTPR